MEVIGSNPISPTKQRKIRYEGLFFVPSPLFARVLPAFPHGFSIIFLQSYSSHDIVPYYGQH